MVKIMHNDTRKKITDFLFIDTPWQDLTIYDLVIILGNDYYKENALTIKKLLDNEKITNTTKIIITGNKGTINENIRETEAEIIYKHLLELGLDLDCILEKNATNIKENLLYVKDIIKDFTNYQKILIIGKSFIGRRVLMTLDNLNYPLEKINFYGLEVNIKKDNWYTIQESKKRIMEELIRIANYTLKGDLKMEENI